MKLIIDISEEIYERCRKYELHCGEAEVIEGAVANGTPLPKGHGQLVDFDELCKTYWDGNYMEIHKDDLQNIQTILKADKESEES